MSTALAVHMTLVAKPKVRFVKTGRHGTASDGSSAGLKESEAAAPPRSRRPQSENSGCMRRDISAVTDKPSTINMRINEHTVIVGDKVILVCGVSDVPTYRLLEYSIACQ